MKQKLGEFFDYVKSMKATKGKSRREKKDKNEKAEEQQVKKEGATNQKDNDEEPKCYSFSSSVYTCIDGVKHMYRGEIDSKTDKKKVEETRTQKNA